MNEVKFEALVALSREAEDNATSRGLHRIPSPTEAGKLQTERLKDSENQFAQWAEWQA